LNRKKIIELRSEGEAHLFAAIAKADKTVSETEMARAPYLAERCRSVMDVLNIDNGIKDNVGIKVKNIFKDDTFLSWSARMHLDRALQIFHEAKDQGDFGIDTICDRVETCLEKLAFLDGYSYSESSFLKEIIKQLKLLK